MGKIVLDAKGLIKSYINGKNKLKVLDGINFSLEEGKIITVVGKSGSGKSTLLNILSTLDNPDEGEIVIDGKNTQIVIPKKLHKHLEGVTILESKWDISNKKMKEFKLKGNPLIITLLIIILLILPTNVIFIPLCLVYQFILKINIFGFIKHTVKASIGIKK